MVVFVTKYVLGLRWYSDLEQALHEVHLQSLVGLEKVPSPRSISRAHEDIHPRVMKRAYRDWIQENQHTQRVLGRLIAIDSTFLVVYGKTYQRVGVSYKPKGRKGYRLTIAFDVVSNVPICFLLAPANKTDSKMLVKSVNEVERFLPANPERIYLFDKGYWKGANFQILDEAGIRFITQVKWYATIAQTINDQLEDSPLIDQQPTELSLNHDKEDVVGFKKKLRVIAIPDDKGKRARQETTKEDPDNTRDEVKYTSGRPFCLLTNVWDLPIATLARHYEQRWQIEEFIRQAKQAWHMNTFCNTDHNAIKTHLWVLFYSYSLVQFFRRDVMNHNASSHLAVGRLRQQLFCRSGRVWLYPSGGTTITFSHQHNIDAKLIPFLADWCEQQRLHLLGTLLLCGLIIGLDIPLGQSP